MRLQALLNAGLACSELCYGWRVPGFGGDERAVTPHSVRSNSPSYQPASAPVYMGDTSPQLGTYTFAHDSETSDEVAVMVNDWLSDVR